MSGEPVASIAPVIADSTQSMRGDRAGLDDRVVVGHDADRSTWSERWRRSRTPSIHSPASGRRRTPAGCSRVSVRPSAWRRGPELLDERHPVRSGGRPCVAAVGERELFVVDVDAVVSAVGGECPRSLSTCCARVVGSARTAAIAAGGHRVDDRRHDVDVGALRLVDELRRSGRRTAFGSTTICSTPDGVEPERRHLAHRSARRSTSGSDASSVQYGTQASSGMSGLGWGRLLVRGDVDRRTDDRGRSRARRGRPSTARTRPTPSPSAARQRSIGVGVDGPACQPTRRRRGRRGQRRQGSRRW